MKWPIAKRSLLDGEYMLNEFVDRFGPRLAQLHGVLQVLVRCCTLVWVEETRRNPATDNAVHRQRQYELGQWKQANPKLAQRCKRAAETLNRVQNEFLKNLTDEVADSEESLLDGEYMLNEFVDRFGPRLAQLHGVLQVLSQLSWVSEPTGGPQ